MVHEATGSLLVAGLVVAAFAIGVGAARPVQGRAIDRRGSRPVCLASGALHLGALVGLVAAAAAGGPDWAFVALGLLMGAGLPPISTSMRVEWGQRTGPQDRTGAYSLVFLVQEVAVLTGPLVLGAVMTVGSASAALLVLGALAGAGMLGFAWSIRSGRPDRPVAGRRPGALSSPGMAVLLGIVVLFSATIGALNVALPAVAIDRGRPATTGVLVAAYSLGAIAGALGYGLRRWSAHPTTRLVVLLLAGGLLLAPLVVTGSLLLVGFVLVGVGATVNPAFTTASLLIDVLTPDAPAEAFGWMSAGIGLGTAIGGGLAGALGEHRGPAAGFLLAAALTLLAAAVAATSRRRLGYSSHQV